MYLLIQGSEEGKSVKFLSPDDVRDLLADPVESFGVQSFMGAVPERADPNYWTDGQAMLVKCDIVVPVQGGYRLP